MMIRRPPTFTAMRKRVLDRVVDVERRRGARIPRSWLRVNEVARRLVGAAPANWRRCHVDHIVPLQAFDLGEQWQVEAAFSPENHQWLGARANLSKGMQVDHHALLSLKRRYERRKRGR